ncbi:MAG TPA: c-type cytochrome [Rhizobacter sp.]|nr:c-type cytochrome [Rhizobacter sp.]
MRRWRGLVVQSVAALAVLASACQAGAQQKKNPAPARAASNAAPASVGAAGYAQRFATVCAACHGANGRSELPNMPVLAGQPSFYAITQLFLFREGRRSNEAMTAVAKTLNDDDLRGFSDYIGTLPPVPAPPAATPPDAARMRRGQELALQHKCVFCHGADLGGGQQVARIAGQREDYLQMSLQGFRTGKRPGYTQAMIAAVSQIPPEDLDTLAYYVARFNDGAPAPGSK